MKTKRRGKRRPNRNASHLGSKKSSKYSKNTIQKALNNPTVKCNLAVTSVGSLTGRHVTQQVHQARLNKQEKKITCADMGCIDTQSISPAPSNIFMHYFASPDPSPVSSLGGLHRYESGIFEGLDYDVIADGRKIPGIDYDMLKSHAQTVKSDKKQPVEIDKNMSNTTDIPNITETRDSIVQQNKDLWADISTISNEKDFAKASLLAEKSLEIFSNQAKNNQKNIWLSPEYFEIKKNNTNSNKIQDDSQDVDKKDTKKEVEKRLKSIFGVGKGSFNVNIEENSSPKSRNSSAASHHSGTSVEKLRKKFQNHLNSGGDISIISNENNTDLVTPSIKTRNKVKNKLNGHVNVNKENMESHDTSYLGNCEVPFVEDMAYWSATTDTTSSTTLNRTSTDDTSL